MSVARSRFFVPVLLVCVVASTSTSFAQTATGIVFDDRDGDGRRGANEVGIGGVKVSNGVEVVRTDANGRYTIGVDDDTTIFVIKPSGWTTPHDDLGLPRFYYHHKPNGSPDGNFRFKGVAPTGPLPTSIDFPLRRQVESERFEVVLVADPQPYDREEVDWYTKTSIRELTDYPAAFGIALGDIVGDDLSLLEPLNRAQAKTGFPWRNVYGNHDMNFMATDDAYADETFERVYGPVNYAFDYGRVHFIVLDNVLWRGFAGLGDNGKPKIGNYTGHLTDKILKFVENDLATVDEDRLIVLCTHIPLINPTSEKHATPQLKQLMQLLSRFSNTVSFSGHTHRNGNYFAGIESGYTPRAATEHHHHNVGTASGSWYRGPRRANGVPVATMCDGTPMGYAVATFDDNEYSVRYKAVGRPADYQMTIHVPATITQSRLGKAEVVVNVFNGSARSTTRMRLLVGGTWTTMKQTRRLDPTYVAAQEASRTTSGNRRPLPEPYATSHIWAAKLSPMLTTGDYVVEVETVDMFGQTHRATKSFRVSATER